jgi:hypothetical protein
MTLVAHTRTTVLMTRDPLAQTLPPEPTDRTHTILKLKCREPLSDSCRLPNGVYTLTKTVFAGWLHNR